MELCDSCKNKNCKKTIIFIEQDNLKITKCLEYKKDVNKIEGYESPLWVASKKHKSLVNLNI